MDVHTQFARSGICILLALVVGRQCADTGYLRSTLQTHFIENRHHLVNPAYKNASRDFIRAEMARFGLEVVMQDFPGSVDNELIGRTFTNVIGILKGSRFGTASDTPVGIGAHYDTVQTTSGVDDNGAGVAAMLETARRLTSEYEGIQNTVIFGAFDIEEYLFWVDGIGSQQLVNAWLPGWLDRNYGEAALQIKFHGVIVLDTVMNFNGTSRSQQIPGVSEQFQQVFPDAFTSIQSDDYQGDFLAVIYRAPTDDAKLASALEIAWHSGGRTEFEVEPFGLPLAQVNLTNQDFGDFLRSDHYHFWKNGYPAIFITDSADHRGLMEACYHHECDSAAVMLTDENIRFLGKIADAMTDTVATLSGGKPLPTRLSDSACVKMSTMVAAVLCTTAVLLV